MTQNTDSPPCRVVLLVDDDVTHRKTLAFDFKRRGFDVLQAGTGQEAWEIFQAQQVDLVVTDVRMPNGHGVELLNRIRGLGSFSPPVILITGFAELDLDHASEWGASAAFAKPFDRKALLDASEMAVKKAT